MTNLKRRAVPALKSVEWPPHVTPLLQRIYAARGITEPGQIERQLAQLLSPSSLGGIEEAAKIMIEAIVADTYITVAGDYDCDGATGTAVAVRGLRMLGAKHVDFIIPDRFVHGYGLTPALVDAMPTPTRLIVTVDSGTASVDGVAHAKSLGKQVVITDHHLPGDHLPSADAIVNPNLNGDAFPSKALAGVGVMFYLLIAMRQLMREDKRFATDGREPDLSTLLDLVALGTVADLVPLDQNNRILVDAGLRRMRSGRACPGINALIEISKKNPVTILSTDIGFSVAPRLNAAGRLENMSVGVEALITDDSGQAYQYVKQLDEINTERRTLQADMVAEAEAMVEQVGTSDRTGVVVSDPKWHAGIVGLVASKLKESLHRPVFAMAPATGTATPELRGSGRSIEGFHLRDALALIDAKHPGLIMKFGGHAMAAGLSLKTENLEAFTEAFDEVAKATLTEESLEAILLSDGELTADELSIDTAYALRREGPWGQAFPEPLFDNVFEVIDWAVMGTQHLRFTLEDPRSGCLFKAVKFFCYDGNPPPPVFRAVYSLSINEFRGQESLQLMLRYWETA